MKPLIILLALSFSSSVLAGEHMCDETKGELHMSIGVYKVESIELCKLIYQYTKDCQLENLRRAKQYNNNYERIDCLQKLLGVMDTYKNKLTRIGDHEVLD